MDGAEADGPEVDGLLPGAARVLAARSGALPQPDQLCGPFAARGALHAVLDAAVDAAADVVPSLPDLARAAGTRVWPHDEPAWRPTGAPLLREGWDGLPLATTPQASGTDAAPLAAGLRTLGLAVVAVPAAGADDPAPLSLLLDALRATDLAVGVVANLRTGPTWPPGHPLGDWDVGHFVVLVSWDGERVGVADSYVEAGAEGWPEGCRGVALPDLVAALTAPPGRGLLLLAHPDDEPALRALVAGAGLGVDDAAW